jgi:calcineurin-like phosphoesterase family protein
MSRAIRYTSDLHLAHANIIKYSRRPFDNVDQMDVTLVANLRAAEAEGCQVISGGDVSFNLRKVVEKHGPLFSDPKAHANVMGNHDAKSGGSRRTYDEQFGRVAGEPGTWKTNTLIVEDLLGGEGLIPRLVKVLVSHEPQSDLQGCDFNVYGHVHNNLFDPAFREHHQWEAWFDSLLSSDRHLNACVELHQYRPVSLEELVRRHREIQLNGYTFDRPAWPR